MPTTLKEISMKDIDFSGKTDLFNNTGFYNDSIKLVNDVIKIVELCIRIQEALHNKPLIPLKCEFKINKKTNNRMCEIYDKRGFTQYKKNTYRIEDLSNNDPEDIKKLDMILSKISDIQTVELYREGMKAGASFVKMCLRSAAYLEKYVDPSNRKARLGHVIITTVKHYTGYLVGVSYIITCCINPYAAIPLLATL